jgi:uncharacterized damage-inducible protein DinB
MNIDDIKFLFEYDRWANVKVFEAVNALTEEQFANVRDTLAHIAGVEWLWFQRCNGVSPRSTPEWMENATRESLRTHLTEVEGEWIAFLDNLTADDLAKPLRAPGRRRRDAQTRPHPAARREPLHLSPRPGSDADPAGWRNARRHGLLHLHGVRRLGSGRVRSKV